MGEESVDGNVDTKQAKTSNTLQAFWVASGSLSSFALVIVSAAILSRYLDKAEYGTYRQILFIYSTLLIIFSAGLPRVFSYFLPRYSIQEGKAIVWKVSKALFLAGFLFSVSLFIFSDLLAKALSNKELGYGLRVFSPIPVLLLPTLGIEGIFATYKKTIYIAIYNTLTRVLMLLFIAAPVVFFGGGYITAIYGWLIVSFISLVIAYFFKGIPFKGIKSVDANLTFKEIFNYSIPLVIASGWGIAIKSADQFYISRYFGPEVFAEFANGFIELPIVNMVTSATSVVLMPLLSKAFFEGDRINELLATWRSALKKSALIIYPILIFFMAYGSQIMTLLYSSAYKGSGAYFQISLFLNFFNIVVFAPLFFSMGKTKTYANVHMVLALVIWISHFLIVELFHSPYIIAINSTFWSVVKILFFLKLASSYIKVGFFELFPLKAFAILAIHSLVVVLFIKFSFNSLFPDVSGVLEIGIVGGLYAFTLLFSGRWIKIDYMSVYRPILNKFL